jgi:hypothetical protein
VKHKRQRRRADDSAGGLDGLNRPVIEEFLYEMLETELGGEQVYPKAIELAVNRDLRREFTEYLTETREHVRLVTRLLRAMSLDPERETPGRKSVRFMGEALVELMETAEAAGDAVAAERVACEAVVQAETKDQLNWELLGKLAANLEGDLGDLFREIQSRVHVEENEHLYHSKGWVRELWMDAMELPSVLPPPEERMHVKSAIGAEVAKRFVLRRRLGMRTKHK